MLKEIIWAVDPYQKDRRVWKHSTEMLNYLAKETDAKIEPVYISTPAELRLLETYEVPAPKAMLNLSKTVLKKALKNARINNLKEPHIIVDRESFSMTSSTANLARYAARSNASTIVVGTNSRRGVERFFLGSFAETLLYQSKTPVLLVGPKMQRKTRIRKILFATDFSSASKTAFRRLLKWAAPLKAEITVFHVVEDFSRFSNPFDNLMVGEESFLLSKALKRQAIASKAKLQLLAREAKTSGVRAKVSVERTTQSAGDAIIHAAHRIGADLIAVATQSGPIRASLGSVARHVVRKSTLPLWIAPRLS